MATVKPVVVGTDGSPAADRAVGWAASAAARRGLPLHIVHAVRRFPAGSRTSMNTAGYDISWAALEYACEAAMTQKALLHVVEVWRVPAALREDTGSVLIRRALADARQRLREAVSPWREKYPDLEIRDQTVPGHPVGTLADRSGSADLLVVGSRGQSKVTSPFAGSVGHGLVHHAKCPVAVVRSHRGGAT